MTPEYKAWANMQQRCFNPNTACFKHYGGRGIGIDATWLLFKYFLEDMGSRPSDKHTLERVDNEGHYSKSNCKWATRKEQIDNRRIKTGFCRRGHSLSEVGVYSKGRSRHCKACQTIRNRKGKLDGIST